MQNKEPSQLLLKLLYWAEHSKLFDKVEICDIWKCKYSSTECNWWNRQIISTCAEELFTDIAPSGGTSRNEGIHRVLNKTLKKSRIGIQFALALLGVFFYTWNEKRTTTVKDKRKIRVTPPIEMHFDHLRSSQEGTNSHCFGMMSDFGSTSDYDDATQKDSGPAIVDKLNTLLDDSSSSSSYEDEPIVSEYGPSQSPLPSLSEKQRDQLINSSRTITKLSDHIQSLGECERFNTKILYFCKSSLTLFHSGLVSNKESSCLDDVVTN